MGATSFRSSSGLGSVSSALHATLHYRPEGLSTPRAEPSTPAAQQPEQLGSGGASQLPPPRGIAQDEDGDCGSCRSSSASTPRARPQAEAYASRPQRPHPRRLGASASRTLVQLFDEQALQDLLRDVPDAGDLLVSLSTADVDALLSGPDFQPAAAEDQSRLDEKKLRSSARNAARRSRDEGRPPPRLLHPRGGEARRHALALQPGHAEGEAGPDRRVGRRRSSRERSFTASGRTATSPGRSVLQATECLRAGPRRPRPGPGAPHLAVRGGVPEAPQAPVPRPPARRLLRRPRPGPRRDALPGRRLALPRDLATRATSASTAGWSTPGRVYDRLRPRRPVGRPGSASTWTRRPSGSMAPKLRYVMPLDKAMRRQLAPQALPYPKSAAEVRPGDTPGAQPGEGGSRPTQPLQSSTATASPEPMPQTCTVCTHPTAPGDREGARRRSTAAGTSRNSSVLSPSRLPPQERPPRRTVASAPSKPRDPAGHRAIGPDRGGAREVGQAIDVAVQLQAINAACLEILQKSRADREALDLPRAVDRIHRQLELQAKLLGDLQDGGGPTVNVLDRPGVADAPGDRPPGAPAVPGGTGGRRRGAHRCWLVTSPRTSPSAWTPPWWRTRWPWSPTPGRCASSGAPSPAPCSTARASPASRPSPPSSPPTPRSTTPVR